MAPLSTSSIDIDTFKTSLGNYATSVPEKLRDLDVLRYNTIPDTLAKRKEAGDAYLEKEEVEKLVEWKLKHGTFRPKLLQLVQSNPSNTISETTRAAFSSVSPSNPLAGLKILTKLKGIGPATASLLLSVYAPEEVPFFSDELFRWCMWDEPGKPDGWNRIIKYNNKEYEGLVGKVNELEARLGVSAVDAERVAWVLGRKGVDIGGGGDEEGKVDEQAQLKGKEDERPKVEQKKKGAKRKAPAEGSRRSSRRKTEVDYAED